ncbi:metallophosphoesterase [Cytobacillus sp. S13-E01]|uniref:metallophosphoesterase n=1 Tax=Cytobacillus sp. S13-E01 TaxID=3031326 RepID=UPI0023D84471|nr:metallophosphoesterase [Cytobacillus sp. S13-E01]MDF0725386.1 metallophosphoesterase [Cytobacillus sp. S13-E01]
MTKKYSRRTFLKRIVSTITATLLTTTIGFVYARHIEPKRITISRHVLKHPLIPHSFKDIKVVQFSDTHIGHFLDLEHLSKIIEKINELGPDIVLFTGDLLDEPNKYPFSAAVPPILSRLKAPLGKYCIYGNHDHGGYGSDIYKSIMEQSGFTVMLNSSTRISIKGADIAIAGLDDVMLGKPDYSHTFKDISQDTLYTILLVHEPDVAPQSSSFGAHVQLSGHSHGGQIQLPFVGPIVTPPLGTDYYEGVHTIGATTLYVNKGLGTTRLPFRFLAPPEISVYKFQPD